MARRKKGWLGIDPGTSGAIAHYTPPKLEVYDIKYIVLPHSTRKTTKVVDLVYLSEVLRSLVAVTKHALVEKQQSYGIEGRAGLMKLGTVYGAILGMLTYAGIPFTIISPPEWKKMMGTSKNKKEAKQQASEMFPDYADLWPKARDHDRAEASLLSECCRRLQELS